MSNSQSWHQCESCGGKVYDAESHCTYCDTENPKHESISNTTECPNCGAAVLAANEYCEQCGRALREERIEKVIENNAELAELKNEYQRSRRNQRTMGWIAVLCIGAAYVWLEFDFLENLGFLGLLAFPVFMIAWICCMMKTKKLQQKLISQTYQTVECDTSYSEKQGDSAHAEKMS